MGASELLAERAARRLQHEVAHLKEHAPLPAHQPHVLDLHKRAALRRANSAGRGTRLPAGFQKRQRSKSILHLTRLPLTAAAAGSQARCGRPPERNSGRRSCCQ